MNLNFPNFFCTRFPRLEDKRAGNSKFFPSFFTLFFYMYTLPKISRNLNPEFFISAIPQFQNGVRNSHKISNTNLHLSIQKQNFFLPEIVRECLQRFEQELLIPKALVVAGRLLWLLNKVDGFDFQELESKNEKN